MQRVQNVMVKTDISRPDPVFLPRMKEIVVFLGIQYTTISKVIKDAEGSKCHGKN